MKENTDIQKDESFKIAELPTHIRLLGKNELHCELKLIYLI